MYISTLFSYIWSCFQNRILFYFWFFLSHHHENIYLLLCDFFLKNIKKFNFSMYFYIYPVLCSWRLAKLIKIYDKWKLCERYLPKSKKRLPRATIRVLPLSLWDGRNGSTLQSVKWGLGPFHISLIITSLFQPLIMQLLQWRIILIQLITSSDGKRF